MANPDTLARVKTALGITGDYQDGAISQYIAEVESFMIRAGVPASLLQTEEAAGTIARGVSDLWNLGSGGVRLSEYFVQRVIQLAEEGRGGDA